MAQTDNNPSVPTGSHFMRGFTSGAFNGALMVGIFSGLSFIAGLSLMPIAAMGVMVGSIGLFGGVMSVKRAHEENHAARTLAQDLLRDNHAGQGRALAPEAELSTGQAPSRWAERTGRNTDRLQEILSNGSLSAKDRATAILAERDAAQTSNNR